MPRPATGQVIERAGKRGTTYALRFTLPGGERRQRRLGRDADGWTRRRAEEELQGVLADLRRGRPNDIAARPVEKPDPPFAVFAFEWLEQRRAELAPKTVEAYEWEIRHLLPAFGALPLSAITPRAIDRFKHDAERSGAGVDGAPTHEKLREGLSARSVNKAIGRLAKILDVAVEYELLERNAAKGRNRRVKAPKSRGTFVDSADAIGALLDAAGALDTERRSAPFRRPLLATLVFAGLRIDEALSLRWGDVSLPNRRLRVARSKTDAGHRVVDLLPGLVDELVSMRARSGGEPDALVFGTSTGAKQSATNVRNRVLAPAVEKANATLIRAGHPPLPPLTPHSLRRTYVSVLLMLGEPVASVMDQAGHASPTMTLAVYARVMRRSEGEKERLRALVDGVALPPVSARVGAEAAQMPSEERPSAATAAAEVPD
jgi:integrase